MKVVLIAVQEVCKELAGSHDEFKEVLECFHYAEKVVPFTFRAHVRLDAIVEHHQQFLVGQSGAKVRRNISIQHGLIKKND